MPFRSEAQRGWMWANKPKMAREWQRHTQNKKLPKRVSEMQAVFEMKLEDDPDLDDDEYEELHSQLGEYEIEPDDDDSDKPEGVELPPTDDPNEFARRRKLMMAALLNDDDEPTIETDTVDGPSVSDEPESAPTMVPVATVNHPENPNKSERGAYSRKNKNLAVRSSDLYDMEFSRLRADIGEFTDEIDELNDSGYTPGRIAKIINHAHKLKTRPGPLRKKHFAGARPHKNFKCPKCKSPLERTDSSFFCTNDKCGYAIPRALTQEHVADYLKLTGRMTRGSASPFQDLGSRMEHNHELTPDAVIPDDCPACYGWSTSFESEEEEDEEFLGALRWLGSVRGEFTTQEAIHLASQLDRFAADITTPYFDEKCPKCGDTRRVRNKNLDIVCRGCGKKFESMPDPKFYKKRGYSDTRLPQGVKNLGEYVKKTLINHPNEFEPTEEGWEEDYWRSDSIQLVWRYIPGRSGADEMEDLEDDEMEDLKEMFGEDVQRPPGSKPFQDWNKLGQFGSELKSQADNLRGNTYQTQDGQLYFYKDQMQPNEKPMIANMAQGTWTPQDQQMTTAQNSNAQQSKPQMTDVFSPKE